MIVTAEISYYPLTEDYVSRVLAFVERLRLRGDMTIATNAMSTHITGRYDLVMELITEEFGEALADEDAVLVMKVAKAIR